MGTARRFLPTYLLLALALIFGACSDSEVNSNTDLDREGGDGPRISDEYFMVAAGPSELQANVTESVALKVFLYSKKTGEASSGQRIEFSIIDAPDEQTSLSALSGSTDDDGAAVVDLRLGANPSTIVVRADHPSANAVEFTVETLPLAVGALEVKPVNTAPTIMPLYDIDIRVYKEGQFTCGEFRPFGAQLDPLMAQQVASTDETATFEDLGTLQRFVVTGIGLGDRGQVAAAGCADGITVEKDRTITEELLLQLIPLNPVGTYEVTSHWDFTDAVAESGTVGSIIVRVLNVFEDPGAAIYDEVINLLGALLGTAVSSVVDWIAEISGGADFVRNKINEAIENNDALRRIRDAGRDLRDVIANLEVNSELTIGKLSSDYEFRGHDNWLGLTLYWRWNCDENSPPDCGAIPLHVDGSGEIGELGVLSSEWTGRVVSYNKLQIDQHTLSLRYGRLIKYILNEVILPAITDGNAHSLSEAFAYWIGCGSLARSLTGSDGEICALGACVYEHQIENFCNSAINTLFGFADLLIEGLEFDLGLHLGGDGVLVETDSDGRVDLIEDGTFTGYLQSTEQDAPSSPFTATWTAERTSIDPGGL